MNSAAGLLAEPDVVFSTRTGPGLSHLQGPRGRFLRDLARDLRRRLFFGWLGGIAAFVILEAGLVGVDWLIPSSDDAAGVVR
ncbi:hypothetical protein [Bradyrhizobium agreste]|uniref:hypothetical protein n=1 Tax=Bradyrhizobium agreste TaxID=2751811 RepID=UPI001FE683BE|nr:hypothetical protein [Bradyrhizobium agreste]